MASPPMAASTFDSGDNAWMLISSALVLMMTAPGLGPVLLRAGAQEERAQRDDAVRVPDVPDDRASGPCTATRWCSAAAGRGSGIRPTCSCATSRPCGRTASPVIPLYPNTTIPVLTHMLFQGMFFIITPALICGAFAERMKFSTMVVFSVLWGTLIYLPLAHWVWGGGVLAYGSPHAAGFGRRGAGFRRRNGGAHQFRRFGLGLRSAAGQTRLGYGSEPMPPHNMTYTAIGAAMLWVGWFGFNAGSALGRQPTGVQRLCGDPFRRRGGRLHLGRLEWWITAASRACWAPVLAWWRDWPASRRPPATSRRCPRC